MNTTCVSFNDPNLTYGQIFFITVGLIPAFLCVPTWIISKFIYEPMKQRCREDDKEWMKFLEANKKIIPYEENFPLKDNSGGIVNLHNLIMDETPDGIVIMRYNKEAESFEYWADKTIKYSYLETVSRKYVNMFGCTELYIDRKKYLQEKIKKLTEQIDKNKRDKEHLEKSTRKEEIINEDVFIKLKKYNNKLDADNKEKIKITKDDYVCEVANTYIKKGKLNDHKDFTPTKKDAPIKEKITWNKFKNIKKS